MASSDVCNTEKRNRLTTATHRQSEIVNRIRTGNETSSSVSHQAQQAGYADNITPFTSSETSSPPSDDAELDVGMPSFRSLKLDV